MALFVARVSAVSLSAATVKTLLQFVPASNTPLKVVEIGISFNGVTASEVPVTVDLLRQTTAGTSSSLTLVGDQEDQSKSAVCTALQTFSAEPTAGNILRTFYISPNGGLFVVQFPEEREPRALANRIAIRANAPSAETVTAYMVVDE
jgi:hypothetical protein